MQKLFKLLIIFCFIFSNINTPLFNLEAKSKRKTGKRSNRGSRRNIKTQKDAKKGMDLDFYRADIKDVLAVLAVKSGVNIIPDDNVRGYVSIHLEDVTFEEALDTILLQKDYSWERIGDRRIRVIAQKMITTRVFSLNYSKAAEMKQVVQGLLSQNGKMVGDERINTLIISDQLENIRRVEELIKVLDVEPQQVLIEARLIEVDANDEFELGVNWSGTRTENYGNNTIVTVGAAETGSPGSASSTLTPSELSQKYKSDGNYDSLTGKSLSYTEGGAGLQTALPATGIGLRIGAVLDDTLLNFTLAALQSKGKTKTLSNPKIVTVNNKPAKILIGERVPYQNSTLIDGGGATIETNFVDVGIRLEVTPTINYNGTIVLKVHPEVSTLRSLDAAGPRIATREADTTVLVKSGDTIAIGGLITDSDIESTEQFPLLGSIPIIGYLFKHKKHIKDRVELIIFLTPTIVKET
ncbi:secretin N-terminal domain-containing protein [bacterium]